MLSPDFKTYPTFEEFAALVAKADQLFGAFLAFEICEWGIYFDPGVIVNVFGLMITEVADVVVGGSIKRDQEGIWRVLDFHIMSDVEPTRHGMCARGR